MVAAFVLVSTMLVADSGVELNARGEALLQSGRCAEALVLFRRASEADPRLAPAFYNQALALATLRRHPNLRVQPSKKDVLDVVEVAFQLDPKMRERAATELPSVRTTFRGQRLLGRTAEADTAAILQSIVWHSRAGERLDLLSDGTVRFWAHANLTDLVPRPAGHWTAERGHVAIALGRSTREGHLDADGVLTIDGLGRFFDW